jgi:2-keto-4-pentenoate hydratase/2-oxohepta-3-ene-1,7-dioic acid hydratase in catechol pathway
VAARLEIEGSSPIPAGKAVCLAGNYAKHRAEMGAPESRGEPPAFFLKPTTAVLPGGGDIVLPDGIGRVEHEVELAVVIGKVAKRVAAKDAMDHVLGYAVFLDMTARDLQAEAKRKGMPWDEAKGFDTFAPVSRVMPRSRVPDPHAIGLALRVNGELRQRGSTKSMLWQIPDVIARISRVMTLEPGDIIATGTPEGVGPVVPGDVLEASAEGVGELRCRVVKGQGP